MKSKLIWTIPLVISVVVGFALWDIDGFDVNQVLGAWGIIAVMMVFYGAFLAGLPTFESNERKDK